MPRRIATIELGLCFLVMFGTATVADDDVIFDLSEASIEQVAGRRRSLAAERYVNSAPYSMSPQYLSPLQGSHSSVSAQPGAPEAGYHRAGDPQWGPASGYLPPGFPQSASPQPGYAPSGDPSSEYPPSGYPRREAPESGYPYHLESASPYSASPQPGAAEFAYPQGEHPQFVYPESGSPAFGPVPADEPGGIFSWRPRVPHFDLPSRSYSLFRSPASYGWGYRERCGATPWKPRGNGIPKRTSCFRMDYAPYELEHDASKHGPAFYRRHELYPCQECQLHGYHLKRFYKHQY
jgi:hypothetical protein